LGIVVIIIGFINLNSSQEIATGGYPLYSWLVSGIAEILMGITLLFKGTRWSTFTLGLIAVLNLITYNYTMRTDLAVWVTTFTIINVLAMFAKFIIGGREV